MISVLGTILEINKPTEVDENIKDMVSDSIVRRFIELCKKKFTTELTKNEQKTYNTLFEEPKVKAFLDAAEKVGRRNGWLSGIPVGILVGGVAGTLTLIPAIALLGAVLGGLSIGFLFSKVNEMLTRWKVEDQLTVRNKTVSIMQI